MAVKRSKHEHRGKAYEKHWIQIERHGRWNMRRQTLSQAGTCPHKLASLLHDECLRETKKTHQSPPPTEGINQSSNQKE